MRTDISLLKSATILFLSFIFFSGCAAFRASVKEEDPQNASALDAKYDQQDLLSLAEKMADKIVSNKFPPKEMKLPLVAELGIENRTKSHLDTQALANTLTTKLMKQSPMKFVNTRRRDEMLKEQGYQLSNATESTRAKIGRQLGAKYMLTGALVEIEKGSQRQVRVSKKQDVYYQLTIEVTDLETGVIEVQEQVQRLRRASKPIIGW